MYVAVILDMEDIQPYTTVGPFNTQAEAEEAGEYIVEILDDTTLPGHAHPHDWNSFVESIDTVEETIIKIARK
jgi:hypothetical protein